MKNVIGIRVHPAYVYYSILQSDEVSSITICDTSKIVIPKILDIPNQLAFIRTTLSTIILEYKIDMAGIRLNEPIAQNPSHFRINIEGMIQELFANSSIESYYCGVSSTIASALGVHTKVVKEYHKGTKAFMGISNWNSGYKDEERETIVIAVAALKNGGVSID